MSRKLLTDVEIQVHLLIIDEPGIQNRLGLIMSDKCLVKVSRLQRKFVKESDLHTAPLQAII